MIKKITYKVYKQDFYIFANMYDKKNQHNHFYDYYDLNCYTKVTPKFVDYLYININSSKINYYWTYMIEIPKGEEYIDFRDELRIKKLERIIENV